MSQRSGENVMRSRTLVTARAGGFALAVLTAAACAGPDSREPTTKPAAPAERTFVTISALVGGEKPAVSYLDNDNTIVHPDGSTLTLQAPTTPDDPNAEPVGRGFAGFAPYGDGWIVINPQFGGGFLALRNSDGSVRDNEVAELGYDVEWPMALRSGRDDGRVMYSNVTGRNVNDVVAHDPESGVRHTWDPPGDQAIRPVGFVGRDSVVFSDDVFEASGVYLGSPDGQVRTLAEPDEAWGASELKGWITGSSDHYLELSESEFTSGVFDAFTGEPIWTTDRTYAMWFSPDGEHVLGYDYPWEAVRLAILESRSGLLLADVTFKGAARRLYVHDTAWEGDEHVLALVQDRRTWSLVRLGLDGSAELALPSVRGQGPPYYLPAHSS